MLKTALPFKQRCDEAERQVVQAKAEYTRDSSVPFLRYRSDQEEFRLRRKPFFGVETTAQLLRSTLPSLTHASDGLVFQPGVEPYRPRTAERLLKWKFPSLNSVDFLYVLGGPGGHTPELQLQEQGGRARALRACALPPDMLAAAEDPRGAALVTDGAEEGEAQQLAPGCVVECAWRRGAALGDPGAWALLRVRRDKTHANHESVFAAVWRSIVDDIQEADLMALLRPAIEQRERRHAADAPGAGAGAGAGGGGGGEGGDGDTKPGAAGVAGGGARGAEGGDRDG